MQSTGNLTITRTTVRLALFCIAGAGVLGMAVTSSLAAPNPSPAPTTTTTTDTTPPPAPVLTAKPDNPTSNKNAHFKITDAEADVTYRCRLDGAPFGSCGDTVNYSNLEYGEHCFDVRAADRAGNVSPVTTWCWNLVIQGGFPISGTIAQQFSPGVTHPLNLMIGNPYNFTIRVTSVAITVGATTSQAGCAGTTNLTVTKALTTTVDVPRNATRSLQQLGIPPSAWPTLTMPNLATNQDACKNATFSLTYSGEATKP